MDQSSAALLLATPHAPAAAPPPPISDQIRTLLAGGPQAWWPLLTTLGHIAVNLTIGLVILLLTIWIAGWASSLAREAAGRFHRHDEPDTVLQGFIASLVRYAVVIIGGVAVLQQIGVQTTSVLAVLG